ncbi:MAG TPA: cupin domain-containing protein, partial [Blastocatellia bacterium]|nr:cupin domain-containing protein [Blastocatellia bacterium]
TPLLFQDAVSGRVIAMMERIRRIVTGHNEQGRAVFVNEGAPPRRISFDNLPGLEFIELWATDSIPSIPADHDDPTVTMKSFVPKPAGTRFRIVSFPSGLEMKKLIEAGFDPIAFREEYIKKVPGLAESHEVEDPGMHTTDTVDYGIVLSGEIYLELDEGKEVHLKAGDCIVQNGTRHGWRNRSTEPCVMAFIMIGAERKGK